MSDKPQQYPKDNDYYLTSIVFLVEGHLFSVPRYYFANLSEVFSDTFALPTVKDTKIEGSCDDSPFHLEGISRTEFKAFLRVLIPEVHGDLKLSRKEWESALKLANMWGFRNVRRRAIWSIERADGFSIYDKIKLAREFKVFDWLVGAVQEFAFRETSISKEEVTLLGIDTAVLFFHLRENIAKHARDKFLWNANRKDIMEYVDGDLKEELLEVKASNAAFDALQSFYGPKS